MIAGDNSILQRTTDAKKATEAASAKEQIQIQVLGSFGKYADLELSKLKTNLESINATVTGENFPITATLNGQSYTIDENGNVAKVGDSTEVNVTIEGESSINLKIGEEKTLTAVKNPNDDNVDINWNTSNELVATIDSNGKITPMGVGTAIITASVDSVTSNEITVTVSSRNASELLIINKNATTPDKKSPYVKYTYGNENEILCRVAYSDETNGMQIISDGSVCQVTLGYGDTTVSGSNNFEKAKNSYNNAIKRLNSLAGTYLNTDLALSARSVGSSPSSTQTTEGSTSTMTISGTYRSYSGQFKETDSQYSLDQTALTDLEIWNIGSEFWLASRKYQSRYELRM